MALQKTADISKEVKLGMSGGEKKLMGRTSREHKKVETNNLVNNLISNPSYTNPNNIHTTALIDSASNVTLLDDLSPSNKAYIQLSEKSIK